MNVVLELQQIGGGNSQWLIVGRTGEGDLRFEATVDSLEEAARFCRAFCDSGLT